MFPGTPTQSTISPPQQGHQADGQLQTPSSRAGAPADAAALARQLAQMLSPGESSLLRPRHIAQFVKPVMLTSQLSPELM